MLEIETGGSIFMTQLDCNVVSCMHNDSNCCCKQKIEVEGSSAHECCETCCGSYDPKGDGSYSNAMSKEPKKQLEVDCRAMNCMYNVGGYCDAGHIGIMGAEAMASDQTECGSFRAK